MIFVRPLGAWDRALMIGWIVDFFTDLKASGDPYFAGAVHDRPQVERELVLPLPAGRLGVMALVDDLPAGYLTARIERPYVIESPIRAVGHVSHVYVAPDYRRQGVATALLGHARNWFKEQGIDWMQLSWHPSNPLADGAWRAAGFEPYRIFGRRRI